MSDVVERAKQPLAEDARMDAYYYGFDRTGIGAVDRILSQVADAGKAYHNTDSWSDEYEPGWARGGDTRSHVERIQAAAGDAAALFAELVAEVERLRARVVEFPEPQETSGWLSFPCYGNGIHVPPAVPESRLDRHLILDETSGSGRVSVANARKHAAALLAAADAVEKRSAS